MEEGALGWRERAMWGAISARNGGPTMFCVGLSLISLMVIPPSQAQVSETFLALLFR